VDNVCSWYFQDKAKEEILFGPSFEQNTWNTDAYAVAIKKFNKTMNDIQITHV